MQPLTMRDALRQVWEAAGYLIRGNQEWCIALRAKHTRGD